MRFCMASPFSSVWSPSRRLIRIIAAAAAAAAAYILYTFEPSASSWYPRCVFHALTGLECPGCGSTRALHHLLHGRIAEAFHYNAMLVSLGPVVFVSLVRNPRLIEKSWAGWIALVVLLGWGVLRNLTDTT